LDSPEENDIPINNNLEYEPPDELPPPKNVNYNDYDTKEKREVSKMISDLKKALENTGNLKYNLILNI